MMEKCGLNFVVSDAYSRCSLILSIVVAEPKAERRGKRSNFPRRSTPPTLFASLEDKPRPELDVAWLFGLIGTTRKAEYGEIVKINIR